MNDLVPTAAPAVGQVEGNAFGLDGQIFIAECGVAHAETKGKTHGLFCCNEITIPHIQSFPVFAGIFPAGVILAYWQVGTGDGKGFRQLAAGVYFAAQYLQHGAGCRFPAQAAVYQCLALIDPGHFHCAAAGKHNDDMGIDFRQLIQHDFLIVGKTHVRPIQSFGFKPFRQTQIQKHAVSFFC